MPTFAYPTETACFVFRMTVQTYDAQSHALFQGFPPEFSSVVLVSPLQSTSKQ